MKLKKLVSIVLALVTAVGPMVPMAGAAEPEKEMWEVALENKYFGYDTTGTSSSSHMQGICVDDKMEYMYFSYTDTLVRVSMKTGEVVGTVSGFGTGSYLAECNHSVGLYVRDEHYNFTKVSSFEDVPEAHWANKAVEAVIRRGWMTGATETTFAPNQEVTRREFIEVLAAAAGTDMDPIQWAKANGVSDCTYLDSKITREQLVTMMYAYFKPEAVEVDLSAYTDADDIESWAEAPVMWAVKKGVIKGTSKTTLNPDGFATRAQLAVIINKFNAL